MKRFMLVLALVAVAGATYVATAPGSQATLPYPTLRQFNLLKTQVAALKTKVATARQYELGLGDFVLTCMVHAPIPVNSAGDTSNGYLFGAPGTPPASATSTSALTLGNAGSSTYAFFTVNQANQDCVDFINTVAARNGLTRIGAFRNH